MRCRGDQGRENTAALRKRNLIEKSGQKGQAGVPREKRSSNGLSWEADKGGALRTVGNFAKRRKGGGQDRNKIEGGRDRKSKGSWRGKGERWRRDAYREEGTKKGGRNMRGVSKGTLAQGQKKFTELGLIEEGEESGPEKFSGVSSKKSGKGKLPVTPGLGQNPQT